MNKAITRIQRKNTSKKAKIKRIARPIVDVLMLLDFVYLMSYKFFYELYFHAMAGIALFLLFILHNILNYRWWTVLFKGKYTLYRTILTIANLLLTLSCVLMFISCLFMSGAVFYYSPFSLSQFGRDLHHFSCLFSFCFMWVHLLLHLFWGIVRLTAKRTKQKISSLDRGEKHDWY